MDNATKDIASERAHDERREPLIPKIRVTRAERNRLLLVGLAALLLFWLLKQSIDALGPFIIALLLAYLMLPLVDRLARILPRVVAILVVYLVFIGIVAGLIAWIVPRVSGQLNQLVEQLPTYYTRAQSVGADLGRWYNSLPLTPEVRTSIQNSLKEAGSSLASAVQSGLTSTIGVVTRTMGFLVGLLIIPFWLFYVLKDKERGISAFNGMLPISWRSDVWHILRIVNHVLSSYIRGQLFLGLAVGVATTIGMILVGAPYPLVLGTISGLTEIIPVVGPILGAVPGLGLALFSGDSTGLFLKVLLVYVLVQQLENNLLVPKIQGDSVKLHPAIIMVSLVVGSQVGGLFGLIAAVPVAAILRDIYLYLYRRFTEDYSPTEAEASVPSRQDEESVQAKARAAHEEALAEAEPGINTEDELISQLDRGREEATTTRR